MLTKRIIPCLDCRNGRVVKGIRFTDLRDVGIPSEQAAEYERQGADEIVLLDVSATLEGRLALIDTVESVRAVLSIPLTVGGGIQSVFDAARLLESGADKISVNTAAVTRPGLIGDLSRRFGRQCIVLAIDAVATERENWRVVTHSGKRLSELLVIDWCRRGLELGAGEILLTSRDSDGTRRGYDLPLLSAVRDAVDLPLIVSGGANSAEHIFEAFEAGADAALAASIFHDGDCDVATVKQFLAKKGVPVRI